MTRVDGRAVYAPRDARFNNDDDNDGDDDDDDDDDEFRAVNGRGSE